MDSTFYKEKPESDVGELRFERVYRTPEEARQALIYYMGQLTEREQQIRDLQMQLRDSQQRYCLLCKELSEGRWVKVV